MRKPGRHSIPPRRDPICPECGGTGTSPQTFEACEPCLGLGHTPTEPFRAFLAIIQAHLDGMTDEEFEVWAKQSEQARTTRRHRRLGGHR